VVFKDTLVRPLGAYWSALSILTQDSSAQHADPASSPPTVPKKDVAPLSKELKQEISTYIEYAGGVALLADVVEVFPTTTVEQLQGTFFSGPNPDGQPMVALTAKHLRDMGGPASQGQPDSTTPSHPSAPVRVPVQEIRNLLLENGGSIVLGKITSRWQGLKVKQIQEHFSIVDSPHHKDRLVTEWNVNPCPDESLGASSALEAETTEVLWASSEPSLPVPVPVHEIRTLLHENGGWISVDVVTSRFPGLTSKQIQDYFPIADNIVTDVTDASYDPSLSESKPCRVQMPGEMAKRA
jgi:hypothetical protein